MNEASLASIVSLLIVIGIQLDKKTNEAEEKAYFMMKIKHFKKELKDAYQSSCFSFFDCETQIDADN